AVPLFLLAQTGYDDRTGGVAERPIAPVLKTGNTKVFVGSNPTPSAWFFPWQIAVFFLICGGFPNDTPFSLFPPVGLSESTGVPENRSESAKLDAKFFGLLLASSVPVARSSCRLTADRSGSTARASASSPTSVCE